MRLAQKLKLALAVFTCLLPFFSGTSTSGQGQPPPGGPSPAELKALVDRVAANQHRDDAALELYERIERRIVRGGAADQKPTEDKTSRVIPSGTGHVHVQLEDSGRPVDAALIRKQLQDVAQALENSTNPNLPRQKQDEAKFARRKKERTELVEAAKTAFIFTFLAREERNGRLLARYSAEPNPSYKPSSRETGFFAYARGIAWVDESAEQVVRIEAQIIKDISIGGGILGKIYRGGKFVMEQSEVAPGIWLPTLYQYDVTGRKFIFGVAVHETIEVSRYKRIGPPAEALTTIRRELSSGATSAPARSEP